MTSTLPQLLYHQGPCIIVLKPAGLLTQAPAGIDSLESRIKDWIRLTEQKTGNVYLGVPHRLDRPVSGAMVFARHVRAAQRISRQFEERTVRKSYWACVTGTVEPEVGMWDNYLLKIPGEPRVRVLTDQERASGQFPEARLARLSYRRRGLFPWGSWLEIELHTGRNHQIRAQCSVRGHAVLGDTLYGSTVSFGPDYMELRDQVIALHARRLELLHPMTREPVAVEAPLPDYWSALSLPT
jgi:23S rRNA pseudouridine1911/1915/1917 synthase